MSIPALELTGPPIISKSAMPLGSALELLEVSEKDVSDLRVKIAATSFTSRHIFAIDNEVTQLKRLLCSMGGAFEKAYKNHHETIMAENQRVQNQTKFFSMLITES